MTTDQIYEFVQSVIKQAENMNNESFDKTKAFKFVYGQFLNLRDELEYLEEKHNLLDDDWMEDNLDEDDDYEPINTDVYKPTIDPDDLI